MLPNVKLTSVFDPDPERRLVACRYDCRVFSSLDQFFDAHLDFVLILTPNFAHASLVKASLERGFDTLCEKPLAIDIEDASRLFVLAERLNRVLYVAMHCRFRPEIRFFETKFCGRIVNFSQKYHEDWRQASIWYLDPEIAGGGVLLDVGINQLDWILPHLSELRPQEAVFDSNGADVEVACKVNWKHADGIGYTDLSWRGNPEEKRTRILDQAGNVYELDHQAHHARVNGVLHGPWKTYEYVDVIRDFLRQCEMRTPNARTGVLDLLNILREAYALGGLAFLSSEGRIR